MKVKFTEYIPDDYGLLAEMDLDTFLDNEIFPKIDHENSLYLLEKLLTLMIKKELITSEEVIDLLNLEEYFEDIEFIKE